MHWSSILILWKITITLLLVPMTVNCQDDEFRNFLSLKMQDYPEWLRSSEYDPSSPLDYDISLDYTSCRMNLHGSLTNQVMINYSSVYQSADMIVTTNLDLDLDQNSFQIRFDYGTIMKVIGDYSIEGDVESSIPVKGDGQFEFVLGVGSPGLVYSVENFGVTEDGCIDLSRAFIQGSLIAWSERQYFSELSAGGYEAEVVQILKMRFEEQLNSWMPLVLTEIMTRYLTSVFSATPLSRIVGTKDQT